MEKLSDENIQFIDRYLKNSGVEYLDIRLEMTDHVASEIENRMERADNRGFYEIFKEYMLSHKAGLLGSLKKFRKEADKKVAIKVAHNLHHPKTLFYTVLALTGLYFLLKILKLNTVDLQWSFPLILLDLYLFQYILFGKNQYIYINRLSLKFGVLIYLMYMIYQYIPGLQDYIFWYFSVIILLNVAVLRTLLNLVSYYKKNYRLS